MSRQAVDMTGQRFGRLICVAPLGSSSTGMIWECVCDCGNTTKVVRGNLIHNKTQSCGCLWNESRTANGYARKVHGRTSRINGKKKNRVGTYSTWEAMMNRCYNPNADWYHRYGGRGIKVCDEWHTFENFLKDMGERPLNKTIDRIDNDKNYMLSNCKWSTPKEQSNNK